MRREVWIAEEAYITIHEEDGSGGYIEPAVLKDKFLQDASCHELIEVKREGQPGASAKDVDTFTEGFEVRIRELYFRKREQVTPFSDRTKRYRIEVKMENERYSGAEEDGEENDVHVFRDAAVTEWGFEWSDNEVVAYRLGFAAERME
ncbi:MAG: hypothetical protein KIS92_22440 [Planctomycetota bacterium]|nr:hypothetical protein [Planctomycetota bacterium]